MRSGLGQGAIVSRTRLSRLARHWIDRLQKTKAMEVGVSSADSPDAVFAHETCGLGVVPEVASESRNLFYDITENLVMPLCLDEEAESGSRRHRIEELVGRSTRPGMPKDAWMGDDPEELIADPPGQEPCRAAHTPPFEECPTTRVLWRAGVRRIHQNICVDHEHYRPSIAR